MGGMRERNGGFGQERKRRWRRGKADVKSKELMHFISCALVAKGCIDRWEGLAGIKGSGWSILWGAVG